MQRASRGLPDARGLGTGLNRRRDVRAAQGIRSVPLEHLRGAGCVRDSQGDRAVSNMGRLATVRHAGNRRNAERRV